MTPFFTLWYVSQSLDLVLLGLLTQNEFYEFQAMRHDLYLQLVQATAEVPEFVLSCPSHTQSTTVLPSSCVDGKRTHIHRRGLT